MSQIWAIPQSQRSDRAEDRKDGAFGGIDFSFAAIYFALGAGDHAIAEIEKGVQSRSLLVFVFVDRQLDPLRSDPRFAELVRKVGLPQ